MRVRIFNIAVVLHLERERESYSCTRLWGHSVPGSPLERCIEGSSNLVLLAHPHTDDYRGAVDQGNPIDSLLLHNNNNNNNNNNNINNVDQKIYKKKMVISFAVQKCIYTHKPLLSEHSHTYWASEVRPSIMSLN